MLTVMDLRQLSNFVAVAEQGTISQAANCSTMPSSLQSASQPPGLAFRRAGRASRFHVAFSVEGPSMMAG